MANRFPNDLFGLKYFNIEILKVILNNSHKDSRGNFFKIDNRCNADFIDPINTNCTSYQAQGLCNNSPAFYLQMTRAVHVGNEIQTGLNCPECGCNVNPKSLYDL